MRLVFRPQILFIIVFAIILAGVGTVALQQFLPQDFLQNLLGLTALPDRNTASTAAIITQRGKIRIGIRQDAPPFGFIDSNGALVGFDIDLAHEFARRWFGDADAVELVTVSAADRIPRLTAGDVDLLLAAMPNKREREAFIDFSQPYYVDGQTLLVRSNSGLNALGDLNGKRVAALQDSAAVDLIQQVAGSQGITIETVTFPAYQQALTALQNNQIDAITGDSVALIQLTRQLADFRLIGERLTKEYYGVGLPQADSWLRAMVNFTLQDMKKDGTYDNLYQQWFPTDTPLDIVLSPGEWSRQDLSQLPTDPVLIRQPQIEKVIERGQLVVGVQADFWPFSTVDDTGKRVGFDIDVAQEFARRWLGDAGAITYVTGESTALVGQLVAGEIDLIAAALVEQREWAESIDFSQTYLGTPVVSLPLAIGLPQNDPTYRELINITLQEMKSDGSYDAIYREWFGAEAAEFPIAVIPGDAGYLLASLNQADLLPRIRAVSESTLARIRGRENLLRVGITTDQVPFAFPANSGEYTGFDIELINSLGKIWGVTVEFVPVNNAERIQQLTSGEVDLLAGGLQRNKGMEAELDFSQTYFLGGSSLLVPADAGISTLSDLDARTIAILENSSTGEQLQALAEASGITIQLATYPTYEAAMVALNQAAVAGLLGDRVALIPLMADLPSSNTLTRIDNLLSATHYGFGLPAGDAYFNHLVNVTLQQIKQDGQYDTLYRKWFGAEATPFALELAPGTWPYTFATSPATIDTPVRSKVEQIQQRGQLIAGVPFDLRPFGFAEEQSEPMGFDVAILREFAKRWLGDSAAVQFIPTTIADASQKLMAGEVDLVAAALPRVQTADELIDFSQQYYRGQQALLVRGDAQITSLTALNNKIIAVLQGSPAVENIQTLVNREALNITVLPFQAFAAAQEALQAGQVDGIMAVQATLEQLSIQDPTLIVLAGLFEPEPYGIGLPNFDSRFQDLVNFTLQEMKLDGSYDRIYRQWFGNSEPTAIEIWPGTSYLSLDLIPMVRIPAGEFTRGNLYGFPDERTEQTIFLDQFYIDQYEVTNRQYAQCVSAGRCTLPRLPRSVNFANYYGASEYGNYPVIWVSWEDAAAYCAFRGKALPTEAQWEKTARGPENFLYPWSNEEPVEQANFDYRSGDVTAVGTYSADRSSYGVYDLAGNVREWVADWYQWDYYSVAPQKNPLGPETGVTRVLRGGSWNDISIYIRTTSRKNFLPESYDSNLGFRCATATFPPSQD